jgi:hypothetical protein
MNGLAIQSIELRLMFSNGVNVSPLTFAEKTYDYSIARWQAVITSPPVRNSDAARWRGFMMENASLDNTFPVYFPQCSPLEYTGVTTTNALEKGATRTSLSQTINELRPGHYLTIGTQAVIVQSYGAEGLIFSPMIRRAWPAGTPVEVKSPYAMMRMIDDNQARWSITPPCTFTFSFAAIEDLLNA